MHHKIKYQFNLDDEIRFIIEEQSIRYHDLKNGDTVTIDFENVQFITPYCLLGILLNCQRMSATTGRKVQFINLSDRLYLYLERMKYFENTNKWVVVKDDYSNLESWSENPNSINLIEIWRIDKDHEQGSRDVVNVVKLLRERAANIFSIWLHKDNFEIDEFVTVLSEIAQNIFEHSHDYGFVALNKYEFKDKTRINLSILDGGVGLFHSVKGKLNKKGVQLAYPSDYIVYPFSKGMARSGGGGLVKVFDFIKNWNGGLFIRSETSCAFKDELKISFKRRENLQRFKGTHIGIWLENKSK